MEDELRIIEGLSSEQVVERAKALALETEYWRKVLDDGSRVNDAVLAGTTAVLEATVSVVSLAPLVSPEHLPIIEAILDQQRQALTALKEVTDALGDTLELADGRRKALQPVAIALRQAAGLEPADDDAGGTT